MSQKAWKTGYYYSKQCTNELLMIDEESKVWIVPILLLDYPALLDYPEVKNIALGSCTFGNYGLARKEIQEALNDTTESTVGICSNSNVVNFGLGLDRARCFGVPILLAPAALATLSLFMKNWEKDPSVGPDRSISVISFVSGVTSGPMSGPGRFSGF